MSRITFAKEAKMKLIALFVVVLILLPHVLAAAFEVKTSTDKVEIEENLGNVVQAISKQEMPELASSEVRTRSGTTTVNQYIRFNGITPPRVSYQKNDENEIRDFLYADTTNNVNNALFEYELEFSSGLKSNIKDGVLEDYIGKEITMFSDRYKIVQGTKDGNKIKLTLLGNGASDIINEGTSKTFTIDGVSYTAQVLSVEETGKSVRLKVNDQDLSSLSAGESTLFSDVVVGISKIIFSTSATTPDIVEVFVGKRAITLVDTIGDSTFEQDVSVNKQRIENGYIKMDGSTSNNVLTLTGIKYRLTPSSKIYIKQNEGLSQYLSKKESLLGAWDIVYGGLTATTYNEIKLTPTTNSEYTLTFKNKGSQTISIPFISNKNTFKLGDQDQDMIIREGSSGNFNIDINDYFVLTNKNDKTGDTYVMRYDSINTADNTMTFYDVASGQSKIISFAGNTTENLTASATLTVGSGSGVITARVLISNSSNNPIAVDLNGDSNVDGSTVVDIVTADGGIIDLSSLSGATYAFNIKTERNQFEEGTADESISVTVESRSGNTIGIQSTFGSLTTFSATNHRKAMSNYGVIFDLLTTSSNEAETLTVFYPPQQVFAKVYVNLGAGSTGTAAVSQQTTTTSPCQNGVQDNDETGVDCGGSCQPCVATATCSDKIKNQDETGVDCGGSCQPCALAPAEAQCDGCTHPDEEGVNHCYPVGTVLNSLYCGSDKRVYPQKENGGPCLDAYECEINICEEEKCGRRITPLLLVINVGVALAVIFMIYFAITLLKGRPK